MKRLPLLLSALLLTSCSATALSTPRVIPSTAPASTSGVIDTLAGTGLAGFGPDGKTPLETPLYLPQDMTVSPDRLLYFIDWNNHRIRRVGADGRVETVVGTGELGDGPQGPARTARLNHPTHILFDPQGRLLLAAWHNSRVNRVDMTTGTMEFLCGTGARSFGGDGGPAGKAILDLPVAVALDRLGNMLIADQANQRIRKVDGQGTITTIVGTGKAGYSGDNGPAIQAQIRNPVGQAADPAGRIAIDGNDNIYIADSGNHVIRKVTPDGTITTFAGTGTAGYSGESGPATQARLNGPRDVEVKRDGTLYIADTFNDCVRKVSPAGIITTTAGTCTKRGFSGDGGPATAAMLDRPYGVFIGPDGTLYIADTFNQRIRAVNP